jgi:hypothetical protein
MNLISNNNCLYKFFRFFAFVIIIFDFAESDNYILYIFGSNPKLVYTSIIFIVVTSVVLYTNYINNSSSI